MSIRTVPTVTPWHSCKSTASRQSIKALDSGLKPKFEPDAQKDVAPGIQRLALSLLPSSSDSLSSSRESDQSELRQRKRSKAARDVQARKPDEVDKDKPATVEGTEKSIPGINFPARHIRIESFARRVPNTPPEIAHLMELTKQTKAQAKAPSVLARLGLIADVLAIAAVISVANMLGAPFVVLALLGLATASLTQEMRYNRLRSHIPHSRLN